MQHKLKTTMNIVRIIRKSACAAVILAAALFSVSCDKDENFGISGSDEGISYDYPGRRTAHVENRRVLLFYECGFNELYSYLRDNMDSEKFGLPKGYLPGSGRNDDVVLIFSKLAKNQSYKNVPSYLRRVYKDLEGKRGPGLCQGSLPRKGIWNGVRLPRIRMASERLLQQSFTIREGAPAFKWGEVFEEDDVIILP